MYTPQEVAEKKFPKAAGQGNGYSMTAVEAKLKMLAEKVEEYRRNRI